MGRDPSDAGQVVHLPLGHPPVVFSLPACRELALKVLGHLRWPLGQCAFNTFDNGEIHVRLEQAVENHDVFVVCARDDTKAELNFSLMQVLLLISAIRGESPHRLTVVLPSLDYARQDRRASAGEGTAPKLLLRCMRTAGADRFVTVDLHNQAEAAFAPAGALLDELSARTYLADFVRRNVPFLNSQVLVCATDGGGMKFTRGMANELGTGFMMADRFRSEAEGIGEIKIIYDTNVEDVKAVIVVDDMFDTCSSLAEICKALIKLLPEAKLYGIATHGYFSAEAHLQIQKLVQMGGFQWIAATNSILQTGTLQRFDRIAMNEHLQIVDISRLIAGAIIRVHLGASVNVPAFRDLGPAQEDPLLDQAALVPRTQYTHRTAEAPDRRAEEVKLSRSTTKMWE